MRGGDTALQGTALSPRAACWGRATDVGVAVAWLIALLGPGNSIARADSISVNRDGAPKLGSAPNTPRFYIGIGVSKSQSVRIDPELLRGARSFLASRVGRLDGVIVAPERETAVHAQNVLRKRSLSGFYLDATISSVERQANGGLRASVSILVATYPGRDMRAIMRGAATTVNGADPAARRTAIEAALSSALRQLSRALEPED